MASAVGTLLFVAACSEGDKVLARFVLGRVSKLGLNLGPGLPLEAGTLVPVTSLGMPDAEEWPAIELGSRGFVVD